MSVLSDLAVLAEERTQEYAEACNAHAAAEAKYLRAYHTGYAKSDASSIAGKERDADAAALEEKVALTYAEAAEKRCKQAVTTTLARLSAAQSYHKFVREQT